MQMIFTFKNALQNILNNNLWFFNFHEYLEFKRRISIVRNPVPLINNSAFYNIWKRFLIATFTTFCMGDNFGK